jgi:hypothetical protein
LRDCCWASCIVRSAGIHSGGHESPLLIYARAAGFPTRIATAISSSRGGSPTLYLADGRRVSGKMSRDEIERNLGSVAAAH